MIARTAFDLAMEGIGALGQEIGEKKELFGKEMGKVMAAKIVEVYNRKLKLQFTEIKSRWI